MAAALHLSAAIPNFHILEQMEDERPLRDELCTVPLAYSGGHFELPVGAGLGTDLKLDMLKERPFRPQPVRGSSESLWH
jgi:galactonate dehydratase